MDLSAALAVAVGEVSFGRWFTGRYSIGFLVVKDVDLEQRVGEAGEILDDALREWALTPGG